VRMRHCLFARRRMVVASTRGASLGCKQEQNVTTFHRIYL
jgi:hypothetical protein